MGEKALSRMLHEVLDTFSNPTAVAYSFNIVCNLISIKRSLTNSKYYIMSVVFILNIFYFVQFNMNMKASLFNQCNHHFSIL